MLSLLASMKKMSNFKIWKKIATNDKLPFKYTMTIACGLNDFKIVGIARAFLSQKKQYLSLISNFGVVLTDLIN
jgi:hypothetical protein